MKREWEILRERISPSFVGDLRWGELMHGHTSLGVGGKALLFALPAGPEDLRSLVVACAEAGLRLVVIGSGTNLLVPDAGFRGVVAKLGESFASLSVNGEELAAGAGAPLRYAVRMAQRAGLSGLEFAAGIPGTVGGAVAMNAGAYGGCMAEAVREVEIMDSRGNTTVLPGADCGFSYRSSRFLGSGETVLKAFVQLKKARKSEVREGTIRWGERRKSEQPSGRSAGSVFKNPPGRSAASLIDRAGCGGMRCGNASVSTKHAGFIITGKSAKASDVLALMDRVRERVHGRFGITLENEVIVLQ